MHPTLSADEIVSHIRFAQPGIDKTSALLLLYFVTGWLEAWHEEAMVRTRFEAWEYGPTDPQAHAAFSTTFPRRLHPGGTDAQVFVRLEADAVIAWGLGGAPGQRATGRSSQLVAEARATRAYAEAAASGEPGFASGPGIPAAALRRTFEGWAEAVAAGDSDGPSRPVAQDVVEVRRLEDARRLRAQLAERFDTGPDLTEM